MINSSLFTSALQIRKSIHYIFNSEEKNLINMIHLLRLIPMIHNYTLLNLPSYSVKNMIKLYITGFIKSDVDDTFISKTYDNIYITNKNIHQTKSFFRNTNTKTIKFIKNYYDTVVYEKASKWLLYYNDDLVGIETIFIKGKKCRRFSDINPKKLKEFYVATLAHIKFCFDILGFDECYRIVPKPKKENVVYDNPLRQEKINPTSIRYSTETEVLGEYLKIKYTPSVFDKLTILDFKKDYIL